MTLDELNALDEAAARTALERCCGAAAWVEPMCGARPFPDRERLFALADECQRRLEPRDWLEAFGRHPRIGEAALRERFAATAEWSSQEQSGTEAASERTIELLAQANRAYEQKFGFIFIVCATGKSADEMLAILRERIVNDPDKELTIAAEEHMKITRLRLEKLLGGES